MNLITAMRTGPFKRPGWKMARRLEGDTFVQWSEESEVWYDTQWLPCPADILATDYVICNPEQTSPTAQARDAFQGALENFLIRAQKVCDEYAATHAYATCKLVATPAYRYTRVYSHEVLELGELGVRRIYCFVDQTNGDILKAATYNTPAKHARGNIFDAHGGANAVDWHGAKYLRG